jgi:8-oxo-dGTP pyrophosphatase MutT (NUDIX family)
VSSLPIRESARLVILNERNELFLFHHQDQEPADPANPILRRYWVTPGGGVDPGEPWEQAALRELWEETGIEGVPLGPWIWSREKIAPMYGQPMRHIERYYLVRVSNVTIHSGNQLDYERAVYQQSRWWPLDAIRQSPDIFYPEGLADFLEPIFHNTIPPAPLALPSTL